MSGELKRLPCQVCGKRLTLRRDGLVKPHKAPGDQGWEANNCSGSGYRHDRWPEGQHLRHHSGSLWVVVENREGQGYDGGDYLIRCIKANVWGKEGGFERVTHGEYMHRNGWTPIDDDCMCGCRFDRHDHRRIGAPCLDCAEPHECSGYEPDFPESPVKEGAR